MVHQDSTGKGGRFWYLDRKKVTDRLNKFIYSKWKMIFDSSNRGLETRISCLMSLIRNPKIINMLKMEEFPFEKGDVYFKYKGKEQFAFGFDIGSYQYDGESNESFIFYITSFTEGRVRTYGLTTRIIEQEGKEMIDLGLEILNDSDEDLLEKMKNHAKVILFISKVTIPLLEIELCGLNKRTIIKTKSDEKRTFGEAEEIAKTHDQKSIVLSNGIIYCKVYDDKRSYKRQCESWEVKGHYRHYKSGKVVFIKAYMKGTGTANDKRYIVPV